MQYQDIRTLIGWRRPDKLIVLICNNSTLLQVDDQQRKEKQLESSICSQQERDSKGC